MRTLSVLTVALLMAVAGQTANAAMVGIYLRTSDLGGNPISEVSRGSEFLLQVYVEDLRPAPQGVFAAYFDALYDSPLVSVAGPISFGPIYNGPSTEPDTSIPGVINELGAFFDGIKAGSLDPPGGGEFLLLNVPFLADALGTAEFRGDPADVLPWGYVLVFGTDAPVPPEDVFYGSTSLRIVPEPASLATWSLAAICGLMCCWCRTRRQRCHARIV